MMHHAQIAQRAFNTPLMVDPAKALAQGCRAAAICVTRAGASDSIPSRQELELFLPPDAFLPTPN